jgi:hypothetical protein
VKKSSPVSYETARLLSFALDEVPPDLLYVEEEMLFAMGSHNALELVLT